MYLLANGVNLSIVFKTLCNTDITATIEDAVKDLEKEKAETISAKISLGLKSSKFPKDNLSKDEYKALKELQSDTYIVILIANKGRSTVILRRGDYLEIFMDHVSKDTCQILKNDPLPKSKSSY